MRRRRHATGFANARTWCIRTGVGWEGRCARQECRPCQSERRIDDEAQLVFGRILPLTVLHSTRVRHFRRHCLLHFGIGLPQSQAKTRGRRERATRKAEIPLARSDNDPCKEADSSRRIRYVRSPNVAITFGARRTLGSARNRECKRSSWTIIQCCPQTTMVTLDDRTADG